jgi:hypothetical protein
MLMEMEQQLRRSAALLAMEEQLFCAAPPKAGDETAAILYTVQLMRLETNNNDTKAALRSSN